MSAVPEFVARRFRTIRRLGEGASGFVYEALDEERNTRVAVKVLDSITAEEISRFKREFRALQEIQHPNLVTLGELFSEGGRWFFTMELIEGVDLLSWVRMREASPGAPAPPEGRTMPEEAAPSSGDARTSPSDTRSGFDDVRLRASFAQLGEGLSALHAAGKVHRDVKPSNVLVTREGRVVLLDFGLALDVDVHPNSLTEAADAVVGTPIYMAPEQAASGPVGPPADWYAVGVMLYEALAGAPPFSGAALRILLDKQRSEPRRVSSLGFAVPADLDELCAGLLRLDPSARMGGQHLARTLRRRAARGRTSSISSLAAHPIFVGRATELLELGAAYDRVAEIAAPVAVLVLGESGIGKSCLVQRFADSLASQDRQLIVLAGRCYERETLPYKAFDGVIEALAKVMSRMQPGEVETILPTQPGALLPVFPAFRRLEAVARSAIEPSSRMDPLEVRARAFAAIRELLTRLGDVRRLIIVVDDLQWADLDSALLLAEVMRAPDAPRMLFVATVRSEPDEAPTTFTIPRGVLKGAEAMITSLPEETRRIRLRRLAAPEAHSLTARLLERMAPQIAADATEIAREADGHPLFIDELIQHLLFVGARSSDSVTLDGALWSRIRGTGEMERRLVELVSLAGGPLPLAVAARALGVELGEFTKVASTLRIAHLCRTSGARDGDTIEPYHARIRTSVAARLDDEVRRAHHQRLALAYETAGNADPKALAFHWLGAGDPHAACRYMLRAAERASDGLGFEQAAALYQRVIDERATLANRTDRNEERSLQIRLGDALAKAGAGARAARAYRSAAIGANEAEAVDLGRLAAEQLLRTGHVDEGLAGIRTILAAIGLRFPERPWVALLLLVWWRLVLSFGGRRFREIDAGRIAPSDLARCDILGSVAFSLNLVDIVRSQLYHALHLHTSMRVGDVHRYVRALANEVGWSGAAGSSTWRRTQTLAAQATRLAEQTRDPNTIAWTNGCCASALYLNGRFRLALEAVEASLRTYREQTVGAFYEMTSLQLFLLGSLAQLGELKQLAQRTPVALREATERGDLYAAVNYRIGNANLAWVISGDVAGARKHVVDAMAQWSRSGVHLEHFYELYALTNLDLYTGDAAAAFARAADRVPVLRWALITRVQSVRIQTWQVRAKSALALAEKDPTRRRALLAIVSADAGRIEGERAVWSNPIAALLRAGAANVSGDAIRAAALLDQAAAGFDAVEMKLQATAARAALGAVMGGDEGRALRDQANGWFLSETVREPDRMIAMVAPGFGSARIG